MSENKRKREELPELEVDVEAPEPPSKKALRRAKKGKPIAPKKDESDGDEFSEPKRLASQADIDKARRDAPGVWIGNLPWTVTKNDLIQFFTTQSKGAIAAESITRVKMPGPTAAALGAPSAKHRKPVNRGFAYLDFDSKEARDAAITLSENLLSGRAVLIKDSKSFDGRPDPVVREQEASGKPPNQKIFVGNLGFETTEDELREHFSKCGQVKTAFMAKFHDTGKCKGYAWITFDDLASAEKAVRGWIELEPEDSEKAEAQEQQEDSGDADTSGQASSPEEDGEPKKEVGERGKDEVEPKIGRKKTKPRKWWVNRLKGRELRMEYAEDATTRYNKRFGKGKHREETEPAISERASRDESASNSRSNYGESRSTSREDRSSRNAKGPRNQNGQVPRVKSVVSKDQAYLTGVVVAGEGKKTTFD